MIPPEALILAIVFLAIVVLMFVALLYYSIRYLNERAPTSTCAACGLALRPRSERCPSCGSTGTPPQSRVK